MGARSRSCRDPYRRVDALPSSRHVVVRVDGETVADSMRPVILYETGLAPRHYLPPDDVRLDLLTPTDTTTGCPDKGFAHHWTVTVNGVAHPDLVWGYDDPLPASAPVAGLLCFYDERDEVDLTVDDPRCSESESSISDNVSSTVRRPPVQAPTRGLIPWWNELVR